MSLSETSGHIAACRSNIPPRNESESEARASRCRIWRISFKRCKRSNPKSTCLDYERLGGGRPENFLKLRTVHHKQFNHERLESGQAVRSSTFLSLVFLRHLRELPARSQRWSWTSRRGSPPRLSGRRSPPSHDQHLHRTMRAESLYRLIERGRASHSNKRQSQCMPYACSCSHAHDCQHSGRSVRADACVRCTQTHAHRPPCALRERRRPTASQPHTHIQGTVYRVLGWGYIHVGGTHRVPSGNIGKIVCVSMVSENVRTREERLQPEHARSRLSTGRMLGRWMRA